MRRRSLIRSTLPAIAIVALASGCNEDDPVDLDDDPTSTTSTSTSTSTTSSSAGDGAEGADETAGDDDDGCDQPPEFPPAGVFDAYRENAGAPLIAEPAGLNIDDHCPSQDPNALGFGNGYNVYVYRPLEPGTSSSWPGGRFPLAVFAGPNGGNPVDGVTGEHLYPMLEGLAEAGFVVVALQTPGTPSVVPRRNATLCAIEWARTVWEPEAWDDPTASNPLHCEDLALLGHSRGGGAVYDLASQPGVENALGLRAVVDIAPLESDATYQAAEVASPAVPLLVLQGADDEDIEGHGITLFDRWGVEDPPGSGLPSVDKELIFAYDARHWVWGGQDPDDLVGVVTGYTQENVERGHAIATFYIPAFLRAHVLGEGEWLHWFTDPAHYAMGPEAFPDEIQNLDWSAFYPAPPDPPGPYEVLDDRPVMFVGHSQRHDGGVHLRRRIDTMYRDDGLTCTQQETTEILDGSSPAGEPVFRVGSIGQDEICLEETASAALSSGLAYHDTFGLRVDWGPTLFGDGVAWTLGDPGVDLTQYGVLSLRVAGQGSADPHAMEVEIRTEAVGDAGDLVEQSSTLPYDRVVRQQQPISMAGSTAAFLHSVHFPLADFCNATPTGLNTANVQEVSILSPGSQPSSGTIIVDSLEVLANQTGPSGDVLACRQSAMFVCETSSTFSVESTLCAAEPVSGECPSGDVDTEPVAIPHVDIGTGWDGWLVYTPPGWFVDPENLTSPELARLERRCQAACEREWSRDPYVVANCGASGVFETPTIIATEATVTRRSIPATYRDGAGLWMQESLACSLLDDCCTAFDDDVCAAAPVRVTAAEQPLARGEEWVVSVSGTLTAESLDDLDPQSASIVGTVGYSRCGDDPYAAGNASGACPFYLGSAHLELAESLELEVDCDGAPFQLALDVLEIDLVQPALGIDFENNAWKAFPPGALHLRSHIEAGPFVFERIDVNKEPVHLQALDGWLQAQATGGLEVLFNLTCNGQTEPMKAWVSFEAIDATEQPPSVAIDMPSSVTCGTLVDLDAMVTDPDGDIDSLTWELDGVLLSSAVTDIQVDEAYEVRARVRDVRGATATDVHQIDCTPPP